jgi:hypothetical protein
MPSKRPSVAAAARFVAAFRDAVEADGGDGKEPIDASPASAAARRRETLFQVARYAAAIENSARLRDLRERGARALPHFARVDMRDPEDMLRARCRRVFGSAAAAERASEDAAAAEAVVARLVGRMIKSDKCSAHDVETWTFAMAPIGPMASDALMDRIGEPEKPNVSARGTKAVIAVVARRARAVMRDLPGGEQMLQD